MALGRYELEDDHWVLISAALNIKQEEMQITDPNQAIQLFKRYWKLLNDRSALDRFVGEESLHQLKQARDMQDQGRAGLDAQIADLEAQYPEKEQT